MNKNIDDFVIYYYLWGFDKSKKFIEKYVGNNENIIRNFLLISFKAFLVDMIRSGIRTNNGMYYRAYGLYIALMKEYGGDKKQSSTGSLEIMVRKR